MLLNVIFYFLLVTVIFLISCTILLYCKYKCFRENSKEVGPPEQAVVPSFVTSAGVQEWVTSPRLLCMHYYFSSMYSLTRETARCYILNAQLAGSTDSVVQLSVFYLLYLIRCLFVLLSLHILLESMNRSLEQQVKQKNKQTKEKYVIIFT